MADKKKGYKGKGGEAASRKKRASSGSFSTFNSNQRKQLEEMGYISKRKKKTPTKRKAK